MWAEESDTARGGGPGSWLTREGCASRVGHRRVPGPFKAAVVGENDSLPAAASGTPEGQGAPADGCGPGPGALSSACREVSQRQAGQLTKTLGLPETLVSWTGV